MADVTSSRVRKSIFDIGRTLMTVPSGRSPRQAIGILGLLSLTLVLPFHQVLFGERTFRPGGHTQVSLDLAINAAYCGKLGYLSSGGTVSHALTVDARLLHRSIPDILMAVGGSRDGYCRTVDVPFLNNENSLMILMRAVLWLAPGVTPNGLEHGMSAIRLLMILVFVYALLEAGAGVPLVAAVLLAVVAITKELWLFSFSMYIFFIPLLLSACGAAMLAARHVFHRGPLIVALTCTALGFASAFGAGMRTSHLPVYLAVCTATVVAGRWHARRSLRWFPYAALVVLCFGLGYAAFGRIFIRPLTVAMTPEWRQFSYHVIGHPLVLGLALPESDLSRREGIRWDDSVGGELARRTIPEAVYLGSYYEEAMLLYYLKLWLLYPAEMRAIYRTKLHSAGVGMFLQPGAARPAAAIWQPSSGMTILAIYIAAAALGMFRYRRRALPVWLGLSLISLSAALLFVESALIMPVYYVQYHGFLLVAWIFLLLFAGQLLGDRVVGWFLSRVAATPTVRPEAA